MELTKAIGSVLFVTMTFLFTAPLPGEEKIEVKFAPPEKLQVPDLVELEGAEVVDYDGDGILDLLSGLYSGHLLFRKNTGTNGAPKYASPVKLQIDGKDLKLKHW